MTLSILIVNWNVKDLLEKCLESIFICHPGAESRRTHRDEAIGSRGFQATTVTGHLTRSFGPRWLHRGFQDDREDVEIFVVDNASTDGSAEMVREKFSQVKLIENKENLGFAKANNQAIKQAEGEFVLLLNPDTEILNGRCHDNHEIAASPRTFIKKCGTPRNDRSNALEKMIDFMRTHPDCGIAGCKILNLDKTIQPSARRFPTLISQVITLTKAPNIFPGLIKEYAGLDINYEKTQVVDQIMGAFFMIRRKVIEQIGFLDENFWSWFEEVDYCKQAKKAGWKIYYTPEAEIIHHKGQSFSQLLNRQKQFNKSLLYYFKKHHSFFAWLILWLMQPLSLFLTWLDEVVGIKRRLGKKKFL